MYSIDDIKNIEKELKKFLLVYILFTFLFIIVLIVTCKNWGTDIDPIRLPVWPAYLLGIFYGVGSVFSWSMVGARIIKYRGYVYNLLTGLEREVVGKVMTINEQIQYINDLEFYGIEISEDDAEINRLLYLDKMKDINVFRKGEKVKLITSGNYKKDIVS